MSWGDWLGGGKTSAPAPEIRRSFDYARVHKCHNSHVHRRCACALEAQNCFCRTCERKNRRGNNASS